MADAEIVNEIPGDARPVNGATSPATRTTFSPRQVEFNGASLWGSPCFWIGVGVLGTLVALYVFQQQKKKG